MTPGISFAIPIDYAKVRNNYSSTQIFILQRFNISSACILGELWKVIGIRIVLFKSIRNSKRRNEGNFTLKSNLNKIKLCGGQHYLVLNKISTL